MGRKQKGGTEERQKTDKCLGRRAGRNKEGCASNNKRYHCWLGPKGASTYVLVKRLQWVEK